MSEEKILRGIALRGSSGPVARDRARCCRRARDRGPACNAKGRGARDHRPARS
jgi:hypothetical protein